MVEACELIAEIGQQDLCRDDIHRGLFVIEDRVQQGEIDCAVQRGSLKPPIDDLASARPLIVCCRWKFRLSCLLRRPRRTAGSPLRGVGK